MIAYINVSPPTLPRNISIITIILEMLERLTGMVMAGSNLPFDAIVTQLSMGIDIILHISRSREGKRYIDEICSVLPSEGHEYKLKTLYVNKGGKGLERVCSDKELNDVMAYKG